MTAERRVDGGVTTFGVSGYLWQRDLVLYDGSTGSLWSQVLGTAVRGPRTGETLALRPSTMITYVRRVGAEIFEFGRAGDHLTAGNSRWGVVSGRARDGPYEGTILAQENDRSPMYWFAWADFFPETDVYGESG